MIYAKIICLFFAVWFTIINVTRTLRKFDLNIMNFILQAAGITGFVVLQWLI